MDKERKIKLLKETDLLIFFDESTMNILVDHCRKISLKSTKNISIPIWLLNQKPFYPSCVPFPSHVRGNLDTMMKDMRKLSIFTHDIRIFLSTLDLAELTIEDSVELHEGTEPGQKNLKALNDSPWLGPFVPTSWTFWIPV